MSVIGLPVLASKREQFPYVVDVLNKIVPKSFKKGIQIYRGGVNREDQVNGFYIEDVVKNEVPDDFVINLHAQFMVKTILPEYNFTSKKAKSVILNNISLAESINANSLTIHLSTFFYHPEHFLDSSVSSSNFNLFKWKDKWNTYAFVKKEVIDVAYELLKEIADNTNIKISVENMAIPIKGDVNKNPRDLIYDPKLHTYESIMEFLEEFYNFKNVGLCFDVTHYKLVQMTLNKMIHNYGDKLNYNYLEKEGFLGLYPEKFSLQPDMITVAKKIISKNSLFDLQVAEGGKIWIKNSQLLEEGLPLQDNDSGKDILKMLRYVVENSPDTLISFDIEEKDYLNRKNQINSLKMFFDYLSSKNL